MARLQRAFLARIKRCLFTERRGRGGQRDLFDWMMNMQKGKLLARKMLNDCEYALQLANAAETEQDFRVHWVALVALLRAVGHVLKEVDRSTHPELRGKIDELWEQWRANKEEEEYRIFWKFIEYERNHVLKEYLFGTHSGSVVITYGSDADNCFGTYVDDECLFNPLTDGPFAGEDGRDIAQQAIEWWDKQLSFIESQS